MGVFIKAVIRSYETEKLTPFFSSMAIPASKGLSRVLPLLFITSIIVT